MCLALCKKNDIKSLQFGNFPKASVLDFFFTLSFADLTVFYNPNPPIITSRIFFIVTCVLQPNPYFIRVLV